MAVSEAASQIAGVVHRTECQAEAVSVNAEQDTPAVHYCSHCLVYFDIRDLHIHWFEFSQSNPSLIAKTPTCRLELAGDVSPPASVCLALAPVDCMDGECLLSRVQNSAAHFALELGTVPVCGC